jgi:hypothetical protein
VTTAIITGSPVVTTAPIIAVDANIGKAMRASGIRYGSAASRLLTTSACASADLACSSPKPGTPPPIQPPANRPTAQTAALLIPNHRPLARGAKREQLFGSSRNLNEKYEQNFIQADVKKEFTVKISQGVEAKY